MLTAGAVTVHIHDDRQSVVIDNHRCANALAQLPEVGDHGDVAEAGHRSDAASHALKRRTHRYPDDSRVARRKKAWLIGDAADVLAMPRADDLTKVPSSRLELRGGVSHACESLRTDRECCLA